MNNNDHTGVINRHSNAIPFGEANSAINKINYPLSTSKKAHNYKTVINNLTESNGASFSRKLFTP